MTHEQILRRWPRLVRCAQWVAILSPLEATGAVRAHVTRTGWGVGEAVAHFAGYADSRSAAAYLIRRAATDYVRHAVRRIDGGRYSPPC